MISQKIKNLPITRKLIIIMVATSVIAVTASSAMFGITEAISYRNNVAANAATLGDVIGTNSAAAIMFVDPDLARQALMSLAADESIEHAVMYRVDYQVLATYWRSDLRSHFESTTPVGIEQLLNAASTDSDPIQEFNGLSHLNAVIPVFYDQENIGFLYLRVSLGALVATLQRIILLALAAMAIAILIAVFVSSRLQSVISRPIVRLNDLMKRVSDEQDYKLRAEPSSSDEIGALMAGFNEMLAQISLRDEKLADANDRLKFAVRETLEAKDAAISASKAKSDFLARMSHEIRTPMNGVLGMTELLLASGLGDNERKFAETIHHSGETLLAVINDILDFSKIEAGKLTLEDTEFDVVDAVESIIELLYSSARAKGVELIGALDPDIHTLVRGDVVRLRQVLLNLVGNAVKFTEEGEIVVRMLAGEERSGGQGFQFEVSDTGIGIDPDHLKNIFESFAQADVSTTRKYGGTGLGLAISKELVSLMGGDIEVASTPGEGSTFRFTVFLPTVESIRPTDVVIDALRGVSALVVDNNQTNRELLGHQLRAWGVEVTTSPSADDAMNIIEHHDRRENGFDLVLLDYFMPGKDGIEFAERLRGRASASALKVLMLSSAGPEMDEEAARRAGVDLCLAKPVRRATLCEALTSLLDAANEDATDDPAAARNDAPASRYRGLRVLVVEDIDVNLQVATHMLQAMGCEVLAAENGKVALDKIRDCRPDIVFMDCQMPVMDGYTATREQRRLENASGERIPIIALTANAQHDDREKCIDAGMDDFISKPFSREQLVASITRWTRKSDVGVPADEASAKPALTDTPGTDNACSIEPSALDQIAKLAPDKGNELVTSVIDAYLRDSAPLMERLNIAAAEKRCTELASAAHALKSSSANVGANRLSELCRSIELAARQGESSSIEGDVSLVIGEYQSVVRELRATRRQHAA